MKNKIALSLGLLLGCLAIGADYTKDSLETITNKVRNGKAVLVDVREKQEWDDSHLEGAKWLPLSKLSKGASKQEIEAALGTGKPVYIHCKAGIRCMKATEILEKQGIKAEAIQDSFDNLKQAFGKK